MALTAAKAHGKAARVFGRSKVHVVKGSVGGVQPTELRPEERLTQLFVMTVVAYVVLASVETLSKSGLLKAFSYLFAIGIVLTFAVNWLFAPKPRQAVVSLAPVLLLYYVGMVGSVLINGGLGDVGVFVKIALAPLFLVFGALAQAHRPDEGWPLPRIGLTLAFLIVVPLAVWGIQLATGATKFGTGFEVGIFANKNNAGVYAVTMLALYTVLAGRPLQNVLVYLVIGLMFGTLGVLVAVTVALLVNVGRGWHLLGMLVFAGVVAALYVTVPEFGKLSRLQPVMESLQLLWEGRIDPARVTFGDLVQRLNTTDLSFMFRIKHWLELLSLYEAGSPYQWMFGFGVGDSARVTSMHLIPHNDYLRYLYELGLVTLIGFVVMIGYIVKSIGRGWALVPLAAVMIYFFSENLVDNFLAMVIFYFSAGTLIQRAAHEAREAQRAARRA